jgi:acyl carrier protein
MSTLERDLRAYLAENFVLATDAQSLPGDASLTRSGTVDSVGIVELIHFLEAHFGVEIADEDLVPENIDTIDNIVRYLRTKLSAGNLATQVDHGDARV